MPQEYDELRVRLWNVGRDRYFVLANGDDWASALVDLAGARDFSEKLTDLLKREFGPIGDPEGAQKDLRRMGAELWRWLFPQPIRECFEKCCATARKRERGMRLRFGLPPELYGLPIEILTRPDVHLALNRNFSIARSLPVEESKSQAEPAKALTILFIGASPNGQTPLEIEKELQELQRALAFPCASGALTLRPLLHATKEQLMDAAGAVSGPCVATIAAHGTVGGGHVVFELADGRPDEVSGEILAGILSHAKDLRLVALNLCHGGWNNHNDLYDGVAAHLIRGGIPVVAAFPFVVSDPGAIRFNREFLTQMGRGWTVDEACSAARLMMAGRPGAHIEWCGPTLHLREDCHDTLLLSERQDSRSPTPGTEAHAVWIVHESRRSMPWDHTKNLAASAQRSYANSIDLKRLFREADIEVRLVSAYERICRDISAGRRPEDLQLPDDPLSTPLKKGTSRTTPSDEGLHNASSLSRRELQVQALVEQLQISPGAYLIYGEPGTGKSRLASEAVQWLSSDFRIIVIDCRKDSARDFREKMRRIQRDMGIVVFLDNYDDDQSIVDLIRDLPRVIITSRRNRISGISADHFVEVTGLTPEESLDFFERELPRLDRIRYQQALLNLARRVEGSIAALAEAVAAIKLCQSESEILHCIQYFDAPIEQERWRSLDVGT